MLFIIAASINIVPYYKGILFCPFIPGVRECLLVGFVLSSFSVIISALRCLENGLSLCGVSRTNCPFSVSRSCPAWCRVWYHIRLSAEWQMFRVSASLSQQKEMNRCVLSSWTVCFLRWTSILVFGCVRWDDGTMGIFPIHFRLLDRAGGWSDGRQRRDMADRYERSEGQREVRKCILVKVSMLIQNILVKSF